MHQIKECSSIAELMAYQSRGVPVVARNIVSDWELVKKSLQGFPELKSYLLSYDIGLPFQAMIAPSSQKGRLFYKADLSGFNFDRLNGDLPEALKILEALAEESSPPTFYIGSKKIDEYLPGLERETRISALPPSVFPSIWMGNASIVATHNDDSENFACVAAGSRKFTIFPPEQEDNLYLGPSDMTPAGRVVSMVNLQSPDFRAFPKFRSALEKAQSATLHPGDVIYMPTGWWHNVEALESLNILVNFWWRR